MATVCENSNRWLDLSSKPSKQSSMLHEEDDSDDDKPLFVGCKGHWKNGSQESVKRKFEKENLLPDKREVLSAKETGNAQKDSTLCGDSDDDMPLVDRVKRFPSSAKDLPQNDQNLVPAKKMMLKAAGSVSSNFQNCQQKTLHGNDEHSNFQPLKKAKVEVTSASDTVDYKEVTTSVPEKLATVTKIEQIMSSSARHNPSEDSDDEPLVSFKRAPHNVKKTSSTEEIITQSQLQVNVTCGPEQVPLDLEGSPSRKSDCFQTNFSMETSIKNNKTSVKLSRELLKTTSDKKDDSDDDKPLSVGCKGYFKLRCQKNSRSSLKENESHADKDHTVVQFKKGNNAYDDSDDDKPLALNFNRPVRSYAKVSHSQTDNKQVSELVVTSHISDIDGSLSSLLENNSRKRIPRKTSILKAAKSHKVDSESSEFSQTSDTYSNDDDEEEEGDDEDDGDYDEEEDDVPIRYRSSIKKTTKKFSSLKSSSERVSVKTDIRLKELKKSRKREIQEVPGAGGGTKWTTLEHNGVIFPPPYTPHGVKMLYDGQPVDLTPEQEEVATMFAVMKDTDYAVKPKFIANFWEDWKKILGQEHVIKKLELCDFTRIYEWHLAEKEKKKQMSTEDKKKLKEEKLKLEEKYMWAVVDGVKEKVGNFRVEPPGLFRGRGEHPKMGKLKRRIYPEDIVINIGSHALFPECPIAGHRWNEVRHDNTVTWLAFWNDPVNSKECKYVFLAPSSSLKGQSDKEKYEKSRQLKDYIDDIRATYTKNFASHDQSDKQIAVATYLIDRLALRAGNEKDDDEADTVGCCSLKVEHVSLIPPKSLEFDFLGKDSIRYFNTVDVDERVYNAIKDFKHSKKNGDDLFDKLDTYKLNAHLKEIMPGLTAKVFRTYNASVTLDTLLKVTGGSTVIQKIADYQTANKEVAILCNHQRSVSKTHSAQMERLEEKMLELEAILEELKMDLKKAKKGNYPTKNADGKVRKNRMPDSLEKKIFQTNQKLEKMKLETKIKDDLKTVALGTSKINYLDPRITVAWCKRHEVPIEKIFNKSLLAKFLWAMDVEPEFQF